ncbi:MAG: hypothetical protein EPN97_00345 [Alphaproteobacteria bacterium]|nr:MAG: hypothetical protein EPN97_00345 [Alphaproteobacteria bacterium]
MKIEEKDFPFYQLLVALNRPGFENIKRDFEKARAGGDDEQYRFALGLYSAVNTPGIEDAVPNFTNDLRQQTLASCLAVFDDVGGRGHANGAFMSAYCRTWGVGCAIDIAGARNWIDRAEMLGGANDNTEHLREQVSRKFFCRTAHPPKSAG